MDRKRWGVYQHVYRDRSKPHPLLRDVNTRFDIPHSRWNTVELEQLELAGLKVLVISEEEDVHLATSPDGFRFIFSQGHPEYDIHSLLKEYKREVFRYTAGERPTYPPFPEHYFSERCKRLGRAIERRVRQLQSESQTLPESEFQEADFMGCLHNTWGDSGKAVFNNWLGLVYQLTHVDRRRPFLNGVDPQNPLGL